MRTRSGVQLTRRRLRISTRPNHWYGSMSVRYWQSNELMHRGRRGWHGRKINEESVRNKPHAALIAIGKLPSPDRPSLQEDLPADRDKSRIEYSDRCLTSAMLTSCSADSELYIHLFQGRRYVVDLIFLTLLGNYQSRVHALISWLFHIDIIVFAATVSAFVQQMKTASGSSPTTSSCRVVYYSVPCTTLDSNRAYLTSLT
jgi:hypothetical protein